MTKETTVIVGRTVASIITTLVWGEVLGGVISGPIRAWRKGAEDKRVDVLLDLTIVMNQRICDLEEKLGEKAD
jgi:hypothetical protein